MLNSLVTIIVIIIMLQAYVEQPGLDEETPADETVEAEPNKDKDSSPLPTTNVQLEGKQAEPASEVPSVKPNNGVKTAPEDNTDILQVLFFFHVGTQCFLVLF